MKVLQVNVYNYRKGGSEAVYFNTVELLQKHGHEVCVFSLKWPNNLLSPYSKFFPNSKDTRTGFFKPLQDIVTYFYHFEAAKKLEQLILLEKPDIAHVHLIWGQISPSVLPVLKKYGIPIVFSIHDYRIVCPAYTFKNGHDEVCEKCEGHKFYNCVANKCTKDSYFLSTMMAAEQYFRNLFFNPVEYIDGYIYVSSFAKNIHEKYMLKLKEKKSIVLYNVADNIVQSVKEAPAEKYFLFYGRLSYEKGVKTLLQAFLELKACKLKIVGAGPLESELKEYVYQNKLDNVEFCGYQTGQNLLDIVRNAYFIIVPSEWYENNPMTIVEGYSNATPVIGASIGGIPEIVDHNNTGFLFSPGNIKELVETVKLAINLSPKDYQGFSYNAKKFAEKHFNVDKYYTKLIGFYTQFLKPLDK